MKKFIILLSLFLFVFGSSINLYAQNDLTINNNTGCSYTIEVMFFDGTSTCQSVASINVPSSPVTTYVANAWSPSPVGYSEYMVDIVCNACPAPGLAVGPTSTTCGGTYANPVMYVCGFCAPNYVQYTWTPATSTVNAILDIDPF